MNKSNLELLTPLNSVLLLVDYQPAMFDGIGSGDRTYIKNNAVAAAKSASILGVPTILTAIHPEGNGKFISEISSLFPDLKVISRKIPSFDAFEDATVLESLEQQNVLN